MASASLLSVAAKRLEGKVAIITGGASGIGKCACKLFAKHGAKVIIADIQDDLGYTLSKSIESPNPIIYTHCDVTKEPDIESVVDLALSKHGKLDIMYNNAGIVGTTETNILDTHKIDFEKVVSVNVVGTFLGIKHAARAMIPAQQGGSIINTSSIAGIMGGTLTHGYTAAKHGVVGLTRNAAVELGKHGIRVNCISPSPVPTPACKSVLNIEDDDEFGKLYSNLKGSFCKREDVAEAALYLGSDESKYVSGHNLVVDGGFSILNAGFCMFG